MHRASVILGILFGVVHVCQRVQDITRTVMIMDLVQYARINQQVVILVMQ